jgi:hypothetical protein
MNGGLGLFGTKEPYPVNCASVVQRDIIRMEDKPSRPARLDHLPNDLSAHVTRCGNAKGERPGGIPHCTKS